MRQALGRHAVGQAVLRVQRPRVAARARRQSVVGPRPGQRRAQRALVPPPSPATSSRCPTSGSTRGSPRGTSPSRPCRWRSSTSTSPRRRSSCCSRTATCIPTARSRRTSGTSATSTLRCTRGRRCGVYEREREIRGEGDVEFLERVFQRLLLNFTWWVNRKDPDGPQPVPGRLPRARQHRRVRSLGAASGWRHARAGRRNGVDGPVLPGDAPDRARAHPPRPAYEDMAVKFGMHFVWIAAAMNPPDGDSLWDEEDGFYYDVMRLPDGSTQQLRVRSLVGLLPLCAATVIEPELLERVPELLRRWEAFVEELRGRDPGAGATPGPSVGGRRLASLVGERPAATDPRDHARRVGVPRSARNPRDLALPRRSPLRRSTSPARSSASTMSRPSRTPACSAGTRTGAGRSGSR